MSGRQGTDHVRKLPEKFYTAAEGGEDPYYLMFIHGHAEGFIFDSIHHNFIVSVLEHFGLPAWVINFAPQGLGQPHLRGGGAFG